MPNLKNHFDQIETLIRSGRIDLAAKALLNLDTRKLSREWRPAFANLARRASLLDLGLKILAPVVRPKTHSQRPASTEELAEYAVLLMRIGAVPEAQALLEGLDATEAPDVWLFRSFCHFGKWEYEKALPLMQQYLSTQLTTYQRLVGNLNLADTLIFLESYEEARSVLNETLSNALSDGYGRIAGNCYEMLAQTMLLTGGFEKASAFLEQAQPALSSSGTSDSLHLARWKAVIEAFRSYSPAPLADFRAIALERQEFESVRVADLFSQRVRFEPAGFSYLYFGTPYPAFRAKIERLLCRKPGAYVYRFGSSTGRAFQLSTGSIDGRKSEIAGSKVHAALSCLLLDFYKPVLPATVFSYVFAGEYFDIFSSPNRVHQLLHRARQWLEENHFPARIQITGRGYQLHLFGEAAFEVELERGVVSRDELILKQLQLALPNIRSFTAREAREIAGLSESSMRLWLAWAREKGHLDKFAAGPKTIYQLTTVGTRAA